MNYTEIEVLRGIVKDELNVSTRTGIVDKVTDSYVNVRIGHATVLRKLKVIGDISYLQAGSNVIVLSISDTSYCLSSGVFSGGTALPAGSNSYSLGSQYYDKTEINDLLERKSDSGHSHRYDHLEAVSGTIGGFEILSDTIRSSKGNFALTSNDLATRMVMGSGTDVAVMDGMHANYRFWAGDDVPADAPFSVEKDGKIHASAGDIAGWDILSDRLSKNNVEIDPLGKITVGLSEEEGGTLGVVDHNDSPTDYRLWIGHENPAFANFRVDKDGHVDLLDASVTLDLQSDNYQPGVRGWKLDSTGWAELQDVVVRGRIEASIFAETTISAVSGQMVISVGDSLIADLEATATVIQVGTDILKIDDIIQFKLAGTAEWMRVETGKSEITGGWEYGVERDIDGSGAESLESGTACVRKGTATDLRVAQPLASGAAEGAFGALQPGGSGSASAGGWIVLDGAASSFSVITRQGPVWNQFQTTVRIGNLGGVLDYGVADWGLFIGDDNDYMAYDEAEGLRIQFFESGYDTEISSAGFVTELAKLKELPDPPAGQLEDGHMELWFEQEGTILKLKVHAINALGTVESEFDITGVGVLSEVPNETPNGAITTFTVDEPYTPASLSVFVQGVAQIPGTDYTESNPLGGAFAMTTPPVTGVSMLAVYATNTAIDFGGTGGADHGSLSGLADDDHGAGTYAYHTDARGDIRYYTRSLTDTWRNGVSETEMGYLAGIDSDIQDQIDGNTTPTEVEAIITAELVGGQSIDNAIDALIADHSGATDPHTGYVLHSLADSVNDFLISSGANTYIKKTLAETGAILEADLTHNNLQGLTTGDPHTAYLLADGTRQLDGDLDFAGPQAISTTSGALTLSPATSIVFAVGGEVAVWNGKNVTWYSDAGITATAELVGSTGALSLSSNLSIYSAGDLIIFSDSGSTEKARIDGATGNITTVGNVDGVDVSTLPGLIAANTTTAEVEAIITAELIDGQSIDLAIDSLIATHATDDDAHHAKYTDGEVDTIVATHTTDDDAHHAKYTDGEVESVITAEIVGGQSIDNAIDALITSHVGVTDPHTAYLLAAGTRALTGYLDIQDKTAPGTPASGYGRLYVNSDDLLFKDDGGNVTRISGTDSKNVTIGNGTDVIVSGDKMFFRLDEATRLSRMTLMAAPSGSLVVVLKKIAYASYPGTWTTVKTMTLSSASKIESTTGWNLNADYVFKLEVTGTPSTTTLCGVELVMRPY